jgi:hypothetical protein
MAGLPDGIIAGGKCAKAHHLLARLGRLSHPKEALNKDEGLHSTDSRKMHRTAHGI